MFVVKILTRFNLFTGDGFSRLCHQNSIYLNITVYHQVKKLSPTSQIWHLNEVTHTMGHITKLYNHRNNCEGTQGIDFVPAFTNNSIRFL